MPEKTFISLISSDEEADEPQSADTGVFTESTSARPRDALIPSHHQAEQSTRSCLATPAHVGEVRRACSSSAPRRSRRKRLKPCRLPFPDENAAAVSPQLQDSGQRCVSERADTTDIATPRLTFLHETMQQQETSNAATETRQPFVPVVQSGAEHAARFSSPDSATSQATRDIASYSRILDDRIDALEDSDKLAADIPPELLSLHSLPALGEAMKASPVRLSGDTILDVNLSWGPPDAEAISGSSHAPVLWPWPRLVPLTVQSGDYVWVAQPGGSFRFARVTAYQPDPDDICMPGDFPVYSVHQHRTGEDLVSELALRPHFFQGQRVLSLNTDPPLECEVTGHTSDRDEVTIHLRSDSHGAFCAPTSIVALQLVYQTCHASSAPPKVELLLPSDGSREASPHPCPTPSASDVEVNSQPSSPAMRDAQAESEPPGPSGQPASACGDSGPLHRDATAPSGPLPSPAQQRVHELLGSQGGKDVSSLKAQRLRLSLEEDEDSDDDLMVDLSGANIASSRGRC